MRQNRRQRSTLSHSCFKKTGGSKFIQKHGEFPSDILLKRARRWILEKRYVGTSLHVVRIKNSSEGIAVGTFVGPNPVGDVPALIIESTNFAGVILRHNALHVHAGASPVDESMLVSNHDYVTARTEKIGRMI